MDGVKSVYSGHAVLAKKKDSETIDTAVLPLLMAELASVRGGCEDPSAFSQISSLRNVPCSAVVHSKSGLS
jgi:hypothetical protein